VPVVDPDRHMVVFDWAEPDDRERLGRLGQ
jgi:hypothetical protein